MDKKRRFMKKIILINSFIYLFLLIIIICNNVTLAKDSVITINNNLITSNDRYDSSIYTLEDDLSINNHKGTINENDLLVCVSNNQKWALYFNEDRCIFKIHNLLTNYVYASAIEEVDEKSATNFYAGLLSSSFYIEYYQYNQTKEAYNENVLCSWITKAQALTRKEKEELGEQTSYNYKIGLAPNTQYEVANIPNGKKISVTFANTTELSTDRSYSLGIKINFYVTLNDEGLHVDVPHEEIIETGTSRLANIYIMPLLGGTLAGETPGYMVIPDGSGSLLRYGYISKNEASQQTLMYYHSNEGQIQTLYNDSLYATKNLSAPIFGLINGIRQNGVYGIIDQGSYLASLVISPAGAYNINYNYLTCKFSKRYFYLLYGVNSTLLEEMNSEDISISYRFLTNEEATYVGLAHDYQQTLLSQGEIKKPDQLSTQTLQIDFLMSETTPSILGTKNLTMTSLKEMQTMLSSFSNVGINDLQIILKGWNKGGYSGHTPYNLKFNSKVGSKKQFIDWLKNNVDSQTKVYFYNDYVTAGEKGNYQYRSDVAKSNKRVKLSYTNSSLPLYTTFYYLYPNSSKEILMKDLSKYDKLSIDNIALDTIGYNLFSYYQNTNKSRYESYLIYDELLKELTNVKDVALYQPNSYFWQYLNSYLNMPVYANAYKMYSDNVPLIPYILKGYLPYYATYANFNAIGQDYYLRLLDYGAYPAYLLTNEISYRFKYTNSTDLYTTSYKDWYPTIVANYNTYQAAYEAIKNAYVTDRLVIKPGLIKVSYFDYITNETFAIIINYTENIEKYDGLNINANSYSIRRAS